MNDDQHTSHAIAIGGTALVASCILLALLVLLGGVGHVLTKYVVVVALLGACLGTTLLLNGVIDRWRRR